MPRYYSKLSKFSQNAISKQIKKQKSLRLKRVLIYSDTTSSVPCCPCYKSYTMHEAFGTLENVALKQETAFELPTRPFLN